MYLDPLYIKSTNTTVLKYSITCNRVLKCWCTVTLCAQVLKALQVKYGDLYRQDNVVLSGTHTHCGPAGYFQYTLFMISSKGYIKASMEPLVNGIVKVCVWTGLYSVT